jgi:hypothetical protein
MGTERESRVWERVESEVKRRRENGSSPTANAAVCEMWVKLSEVILLLHVFVLYHFSISNNMDLSRGCRRFCRTTLHIVSQHAKPPIGNYQNTTSPRIGEMESPTPPPLGRSWLWTPLLDLLGYCHFVAIPQP